MVKKLFVLSFICMFFLTSFAFAEVQVDYFYGIGCQHCASVGASGVLEEISNLEGVDFFKHEIYLDVQGQARYSEVKDLVGLSPGVPVLVINTTKEGISKYTYFLGSEPIIEGVTAFLRGEDYFYEEDSSFFDSLKHSISEGFDRHMSDKGRLDIYGIGFLILGALIDSVNPCAFGVLIFLLISLLSTGSSKRALKYGSIYTLVVFLVYFLAGIGILKIIQSIPSLNIYITWIAVLFVFIFAVFEFIDFFRAYSPNKESLLKIPTRFKPLLEKTAKEGTLIATIILGALVSLVELPCTGGIYLGVLKILSGTSFRSGVSYLIIYNLIFVLPLFIITLLVFKGASPERLQKWTGSEKKWMKLSAGIVLVLIGVYLLYQGNII